MQPYLIVLLRCAFLWGQFRTTKPRAIVAQADNNLPLFDVRTQSQQIEQALYQERLMSRPQDEHVQGSLENSDPLLCLFRS